MTPTEKVLERKLAEALAANTLLREAIAEANKRAQSNLEQTIPTGGDYVCSECLMGHHEQCLTEADDPCDCIRCLRDEVASWQNQVNMCLNCEERTLAHMQSDAALKALRQKVDRWSNMLFNMDTEEVAQEMRDEVKRR